MLTDLSSQLLAWYAENGRQLPWRILPSTSSTSSNNDPVMRPDPYTTWVAEIMLQQTQVETVIPYYRRWLEHFPTILSLATASEQEVLAIWEGLGYYSRARNLHKAARMVLADYGGALPSNRPSLEKLPGIGRYTAGAITSIAFGQDEPTLDGNIRRVLSRIYNIQQPLKSLESEKQLWQLARANLPPGKAGDYNQALMDLGATICLPHQPNCPICPVISVCQARLHGVEEKIPLIQPRPPRPQLDFVSGVIRHAGQVLIVLRPSKGLLGGLWEFPKAQQVAQENLAVCLQRWFDQELKIPVEIGARLGTYQHGYTHFQETRHVFLCHLVSGAPLELNAPGLRWVDPLQLKDFPMGKVDRQIANSLGKSIAFTEERDILF
jgi:A/G-specific adenine glycosylase